MIFSEEQAAFLKKEFGIDIEPAKEVSIKQDEWFKIQDRCFEIESDEVVRAGNGNELPIRGKIAISFCDQSYVS